MADQRRVAYISSKEFHSTCDSHPKVKGRASMTDSLIDAYKLKTRLVTVIPTVGTKEDLMTFHSKEYVECLEKIQLLMEKNYPLINGEDSMYEEDIDYDNDEEFSEVTRYGFGYDCGVFSNLYDYCKAVTGGTITAANILSAKKADITINFNGGWHHAHVDEAAGFCYVNDIVIGILKLLNTFKRILYIDLDVHHGDGVEEAFRYSKKVMTLSIHNYEDGFFPGTGGGEEFYKSCSKYLSTNVPLKNGVTDAMFVEVFVGLFNDVMSTFQPEVVVCQCGADGLTGDPLGAFNLTSKGIARCIEEICSRNIPVMILGGGGYNIPNTARCWVDVVASVLGKNLSDDIPDHDYLEKYGPDYSLTIKPGNRKNENTEEYINSLMTLLKQQLCLDAANQAVPTSAIPISDDDDKDAETHKASETEQENNIPKFLTEEMETLQSVKRTLDDDEMTDIVVKKVCMDKTNI